MKQLRIFNLILLIGCVAVSIVNQNFMATMGWLCATILQIGNVLGDYYNE